MSFQPASLSQWTNVGTVGTVLLTDRQAGLVRLVIPGTYVGSVAFYDCNTIAGTSATNNIFTLGLPATSTPQDIQIGAQCKKGLVYASTGTPTVTIIWE